jgi:putative acetyltransferase
VHKDYQNQGIASALLRRAEELAKNMKVYKLYTESSVTAKPFFEKHNFVMVRKNEVNRLGRILVNYTMEKQLYADK